MSGFEVETPILNSPFARPALHWRLEDGHPPEKRDGRREAGYYYRDPKSVRDGDAKGTWVPLGMVNTIRERLDAWRELALRGEAGVTRTTCELLNYWRREGRKHRLFFAQLEAAETIIFLNEARRDFLQGIDVPMDEPSQTQREAGVAAFRRYACKMATGSGKTTVMGMLSAWSILNKVAQRGDARYSDTVLVVCPNVTIRSRLAELDPRLGPTSLYRTRDLVPEALMADLGRGRVIVTNWHVFEPQGMQTGGVSAKVSRAGRRVETRELINISDKTTTARGSRYMTLDDLKRHTDAGMLKVLEEITDEEGTLIKVRVLAERYIESETALLSRVLGREVGGKQNILVFNDEAHHAYRIVRDEPDEDEEDLFGDDDEAEEFAKEATVWVEGLDTIHKHRGINQCIDLSATPYYLGRVGQQTNQTFPWVVSDFGLTDAIESGLVKIPQLAVRDPSGQEHPHYFNIWRWILTKLTAQEKGGKRASPKPEAILKWAHPPIAMIGGLWRETFAEWQADPEMLGRTPVLIIVCKNTKIARVVHEWLADDKPPTGIPSSKLPEFINPRDGEGKVTAFNTIRVDTKVVQETDGENAKNDESRWMRLTLDTVGKLDWPRDRQGSPIYPEGFEDLARKLKRPLSPPGRDVRCIVSVGMLTEGWDCNTVTHIVGLRPFMSQLLCEQVVGRGLRRASYEPGEDGLFTEEVAKVLGVPFEIIPMKATKGGTTPREKRHHVHSVPQKAEYAITFPRVERYRQAVRNRVTVDWDSIAPITLDPSKIPPETEMKGMLPTDSGRPTLTGPGRLENITLNPWRKDRRLQELAFELACDLVRVRCDKPEAPPPHVLFPQIAAIALRYLQEKIRPVPPAQPIDAFLSPYYGWVFERLDGAIRPDAAAGETPEVPDYEKNRPAGSTGEVSFWTSRETRPVVRSHLNAVVADTKKWEQQAAYYLDHTQQEGRVLAFVKNDHLGFTIPYLHNGQPHDYVPDFLVRLATPDPRPTTLILETKGYDPLKEVKKQAAERWCAAVNAEGSHGRWLYRVADKPEQVSTILADIIGTVPRALH
ncbi:MAG: hypothetical protein RL689_1354 [Planctomycetota bacterium]|jgi:type III restriction enzyme